MKNILKKIKKNIGSIPLDVALLIPGILLICFLMIDFIYISNQKADIQRRSDSAALSIANAANAEGEINIDENGYLTTGERAGCKVCAITRDDFEKGISQLRNDLNSEQYDINYFEDNTARYDKLSQAQLERMKNGVVRLQFKGKVYGLLSKFAGFDWGFDVLIDSTAICNGSAVLNPNAVENTIHTITYILHGGSFTSSPAYSYISSIGYTLPIPERAGYIFDGWFRDAEFNNGPYLNIAVGSRGDLTFYTKWHKNELTYTIKYVDVDTNTLLNTKTVTLNLGDTYTIPILTIDNYEFVAITSPLNKTVIDTNVLQDNRDIIVTYKEKIHTIDLIYKTDKEEVIPITYKKSYGALKLSDYYKKYVDFDFEGFFTDQNKQHEIDEINGDNFIGLVTIYAFYKPIEYKDAYWKINVDILDNKILNIYPYEEPGSKSFKTDIINCPWETEKAEIYSVFIVKNSTINEQTYVRPKYINNWFNNMPKCTAVDIIYLDTSNIIDFSSMFENDINLYTVNFGGVNNFKQASSFKNMFKNCSTLGLKEKPESNSLLLASLSYPNDFKMNAVDEIIQDYFTTVSAKDFSGMFEGTSIARMDLTKIRMDSAEDVSSMFKNCIYLNNFYFNSVENNIIHTVNLSNVKDFSSMFENCVNLGINVESHNTNGELIYSNKYIDLTYILTGYAHKMKNMFKNCYNLKTIYSKEGSFRTDYITDNGSNMFDNCVSLVGGAGTTYSTDYLNVEYARIDTPTVRGYFSNNLEYPIKFELNGGEWIFKPLEPLQPDEAYYTVEHYFENINDNNYTIAKTKMYKGIINTQATAYEDEFEGFTFDSENDLNISSGIITADNKLTLKLYYKRIISTITFKGDVITDYENNQMTYQTGDTQELPIPIWGGPSGPNYLPIGGKVFLDNGDNGATYKFYDSDKNEIIYTDLNSLDNAVYYTVDGAGLIDRFYVVASDSSKSDYNSTYGVNFSAQKKCWGYCEIETGTTIDSIGSGKTNTATILAIEDTSDCVYSVEYTSGSIWEWLNDVNSNQYGGCDDWFIGSKAEYDALKSSTKASKLFNSKYYTTVWTCVESSSRGAYLWYSNSNDWERYNKRTGGVAVAFRTLLSEGAAQGPQMEFAGWWTKDGTQDGDWGTQVTSISAANTGDMDLYAKWEKISNSN